VKWTWSEKGKRFLESTVSLRVRFCEVDILQVVWHGHYFTYFEEGRNAFGREYQFDYENILKEGYIVPLVHAEVDYFARRASLTFSPSAPVCTQITAPA